MNAAPPASWPKVEKHLRLAEGFFGQGTRVRYIDMTSPEELLARVQHLQQTGQADLAAVLSEVATDYVARLQQPTVRLTVEAE